MVFYRKYRPQKIAELDSKNVRDTLSSVLSGKSLVHALLFTGPKGTGKTSTARIVAKAINCERLEKKRLASSSGDKKLNAKRYTLNVDIEPCNKCSQCISITNGSNIDILEIDGASNRGIDEIRDLREKIRLSPAKAFKKVYIIDEVHMLTTEAFNALLKTLEEPPKHAMFIFCTTEPHKVPATILSRCFHVQFNRASNEELVSSFNRIIEGEKLKADNGALLDIAKLSDGSFRDGAKILEEIALRSAGKKITQELVEEKYQVSSIKYQVSEMLKLLKDKDTKGGLGLVSKLTKQGTDMKYFIEQLIDSLHKQLLAQLGVEKQELGIMNYELGIEDIKQLVEHFTKAHSELKYAVLPQLPLELVIIEWSSKQDSEHSEYSDKSGSQNSQKVRKSDTPTSRISGSPSNSEFSDLLRQLIEKVKTQNHSLAGVLRSCQLENFDDKKLTITTPYKFHKEKLEEPKSLEILKRAVSEITGNPLSIDVLLKDKES